MFANRNSIPRSKFGNLIYSDPGVSTTNDDDDFAARNSCVSEVSPGCYDRNRMSYEVSPCNKSPYTKSPWSRSPSTPYNQNSPFSNGLIGSLVREEGHIYSLAATSELLYTGSDSKNIRVWKNLKEFSAFKSASGLVKAIVISGDKIFTGHQDGKIRVWKVSIKNPSVHKRAGTLPCLKDLIKSSMKPSNYIEVKGHRSLWIKHSDAISCLSLNEEQGILYSGSWDKTLKVWRISDSKCLESINAHDDAVNSVVSGSDGLVFTGSADGSVKVWRRDQFDNKSTKHSFVKPLLKQESAVTALAFNRNGSVVYCGSSDGLLNFWNQEKQLSHGGTLKGHKLAILCIAAAGKLIFSGSADKTICVWRRDNGEHSCLSVLTGHTGPVKCLAVEDDEKSKDSPCPKFIVYSGSLDKSVKVWSVSEELPDMGPVYDMP